MNLWWHLLAKDFRRLRGRLAAWLVVLGLKYVIGFWLLHASGDLGERVLTGLQMAVGGLVFTDVALTWLLVALLLHEDAVAGTPAFWRTRPIAGGRLLASKVLGIVFFLLAPAVLIAVPWWVACGLTPPQMTAAAVEVLVVQGGVALLAAGAASVTNSLARCLVWGLVGTAGAYGFAIAWTQGPLAKPEISPGATLAMWGAVLVLLLANLVVWQFLTRRRGLGLGLLVGGLLLAPPVATLAVKTLATGATRASSALAEEGDGAAHNVTVEWISARRKARSERRGVGEIELGYVARGVPPGHLVAGRGAMHTVRSGDRRLAVYQNAVGGENQGLLAIRVAASEARVVGAQDVPRTIPLRSWFLLTAEDQAATENLPLDVDVELRLQLVRPVILEVMAAQPGPWRAQAGHGGRVLRVMRPQDEAMAVVLESEPLGVARAVWREWRDRRWYPRGSSVVHVVQRVGAAPRSTSTRVLASLTLGGVELRVRMIVLGGSADGATVTRVDLSDGQPFARKLHLPGLVAE
jgi:hypothetical protein